jgi:hypothetical protein
MASAITCIEKQQRESIVENDVQTYIYLVVGITFLYILV